MIIKRMYADDLSAYLAMEAARRKINGVLPFATVLEEERSDGIWHLFWNVPDTLKQEEFDKIVEKEIELMNKEFESGEENRQPH